MRAFADDGFIYTFVLLAIQLKLAEDYSRPKLNYTNVQSGISVFVCAVPCHFTVLRFTFTHYATLCWTESEINC